MLYKEFKVEVGKVLAAKITVSYEDLATSFDGCISKVVKDFMSKNPEYSKCSYTDSVSKGIWTISLWTTSDVVYKEV